MWPILILVMSNSVGFHIIIMADNNRTILVYLNTYLWEKNLTCEKIQHLRSRSFHVQTTDEIRILQTGRNMLMVKITLFQNFTLDTVWNSNFQIWIPHTYSLHGKVHWQGGGCLSYWAQVSCFGACLVWDTIAENTIENFLIEWAMTIGKRTCLRPQNLVDLLATSYKLQLLHHIIIFKVKLHGTFMNLFF